MARVRAADWTRRVGASARARGSDPRPSRSARGNACSRSASRSASRPNRRPQLRDRRFRACSRDVSSAGASRRRGMPALTGRRSPRSSSSSCPTTASPCDRTSPSASSSRRTTRRRGSCSCACLTPRPTSTNHRVDATSLEASEHGRMERLLRGPLRPSRAPVQWSGAAAVSRRHAARARAGSSSRSPTWSRLRPPDLRRAAAAARAGHAARPAAHGAAGGAA